METARVSGSIGPWQAAAATGENVQAFDGPVEYEGYQREGFRHAWTRQPDAHGRYHAITLQRREEDAGAWVVTADQPFDTLERAAGWARRLFEETEG